MNIVMLLFCIIAGFFIFFGCSKAMKKSSSFPSIEQETLEEREKGFQQYPNALYPIEKNGKWGYMNRATKIIIQPQYENVEDFFEGRAKIQKNGKYGYIDSTGKEIILAQFEKAENFFEGFAKIKKNEKYGFIDKTGKEIISPQFEDAGNFSEGFAAVKINGKTGFINREGKIIIQPQFLRAVYVSQFSEGLASVYTSEEEGGGYIDKKGEWIIQPNFIEVGPFRNGLARVAVQEDKILTGFLDKGGLFVIAPSFTFAWDFSENFVTGWTLSEDRTKKIWKCMDTQGNIVLDNLPYRTVGACVGGFIPIQNSEMKWGFMDITGKEIIPPQFSGINHFKNGLARMEIGDFSRGHTSIVYINPTGKIVWQP